MNARNKIEHLLACAGITIDGNRPWDLQVHNDNFYARLISQGSLGLGESYMDEWWDCERLDAFFHKISLAELDTRITCGKELIELLRHRICNLQKPSRAFQIGDRHYDMGNNLYRHMLDDRLTYSCGYWKDASTLDKAQEEKLRLVCRKLGLQPGMRVLDIGCGWGGAAEFAARLYRVDVTGITVSREQQKFGMALCRGLPVEIRLQDYRDMTGTFDRIFSLGMFEHVGYKNYETFFRVVKRLLRKDGLFLLQTIGNNRSAIRIDPWIERYIFPNAMIPSAKQICTAAEGLFVLEDWHSFGTDYDKTLMHWFHNFHKNWDAIKKDYDARFYRMWKYYLLSSAGFFRGRRKQLWQIVFSPNGIADGYRSIR